MTIQRDDDRFSRVADDYDDDQQYDTITDDSIQWDFNAGQLGPEEQHSTTSFNTWSDASSLEDSRMALDDDAIGLEVTSMEDLQRRLFEIFHSRPPVRTAALHRRRSRATRRVVGNDVVFAYDSMVFHRQRTDLTHNSSTHPLIGIEEGLPNENQGIVSRNSRDPLADVDPFMQDSMKLTRARMTATAALQILSNESQHHSVTRLPAL